MHPAGGEKALKGKNPFFFPFQNLSGLILYPNRERGMGDMATPSSPSGEKMGGAPNDGKRKKKQRFGTKKVRLPFFPMQGGWGGLLAVTRKKGY